MESRLDGSTIEAASLAVATETARAAIAWAWTEFGTGLCLLSSMQDAVLIDLAMDVSSEIPVVFLDNGYHFPETYDMVASVEGRYGIEVERVRTRRPVIAGSSGADTSDIAAGDCCDLKVDLLERALDGRGAWLSGISRDQTPERAETSLIDTDRRGLVKVSPLAQWNDGDRQDYLDRHRILRHPLLDLGYTSIGCAPCTTPSNAAGGRSGRWAGMERTECGLHL